MTKGYKVFSESKIILPDHFKIGDWVALRSNGRSMRIVDIVDGKAVCGWIRGRGVFAFSSLDHLLN